MRHPPTLAPWTLAALAVMAGGFGACRGDRAPERAASETTWPTQSGRGEGGAECERGTPVSGDIDGDGRVDGVTVEAAGEWEWLVVVRRGAGDEARVAVRSVCPRLLGTADVNSDGRHEIWFENGPGNTAQDFNIVSWVGDGLRAAVASSVDNPLMIGWGMSGGATLWCADADGDGRTDIVQNSFRRTSRGEEVDQQEVILRLDGGQLVEIYRGPPRTPLPGTASALVCGAVRS